MNEAGQWKRIGGCAKPSKVIIGDPACRAMRNDTRCGETVDDTKDRHPAQGRGPHSLSY